MDPIRRDLEEKLVRTQKELDERVANNPYDDQPTSWKTIGWLFVLLVLAAIGYVLTAGG